MAATMTETLDDAASKPAPTRRATQSEKRSGTRGSGKKGSSAPMTRVLTASLSVAATTSIMAALALGATTTDSTKPIVELDVAGNPLGGSALTVDPVTGATVPVDAGAATPAAGAASSSGSAAAAAAGASGSPSTSAVRNQASGSTSTPAASASPAAPAATTPPAAAAPVTQAPVVTTPPTTAAPRPTTPPTTAARTRAS